MRPSFFKKVAGFNLTELAVVLAVMGVVLGTVWSSAASVRENAKREAVQNQVVVLVKKIRDLYQGQDGVLGTITVLPHTLYISGAISEEWMRDAPTYTMMDHPWGAGANGSFQVHAGLETETGSNSSQEFTLVFNTLPEGACAFLAKRFAGVSEPEGLMDLSINGTSRLLAAVSADFNTILGWCGTSGSLALTYRLRANTI